MSRSPDCALRVFVSYARNDDLHPIDSDSSGFVTTLVRHLDYHIKSLGPPALDIWRDKTAIEPSSQFDPAIAAGIDASDVLLVVLSNNWIHRLYCQKELERFAKRWQLEDSAAIKRRIVVVSKHPLCVNARPELLRGQEGHQFYRLDDDDPSKFVELFGRARLSEEFYDAARRLAVDLWNRARLEAQVISKRVGTPECAPGQRSRPTRTIYIAKPGPDVKASYLRVIEELQLRGYRTVPELEIPLDASAETFINEALAEAECSVHLLGDRVGFTPEDSDMPIVKLQLHLAAVRAGASVDDVGPNFHRIIWAPKFFGAKVNARDENAGPRDPQVVLNKFDSELPTDKVDGSEMGAFVEFILQHLEETASPRGLSWRSVEPDARVYVCHSAEDLPYALELGSALQKRNVEPMMPALEGDAAEVAALHHRELAECDAVILCWAKAPDVWLRSHSRELRSWRTLGRQKEFAYRGVVAGPPPRETKNLLLHVPPRSEVDVVLDLTEVDAVTPETLDPLFHIGPPNQ